MELYNSRITSTSLENRHFVQNFRLQVGRAPLFPQELGGILGSVFPVAASSDGGVLSPENRENRKHERRCRVSQITWSKFTSVVEIWMEGCPHFEYVRGAFSFQPRKFQELFFQVV